MSRFRLLSDAQWLLIEAALPGRTGRAGRPFADARTMVEGIIYRYRCGIAWRDLPVLFGPWQTVWRWHRMLAGDGTWDRLLAVLTAQADREGLVNWSISVDSTIRPQRLPADRGRHAVLGPRAPARDQHRPAHRGLGGTTTIRWPSRLIMLWAAPAVGCRPSCTTSSMATVCHC